MTGKPLIFVSYAHADKKKWLDPLRKQLDGLANYAEVECFDDGALRGGADWDKDLRHKLEQASIFLPLITASFMASKYINTTELPIAKRRREQGECQIIPILLEDVYWQLLGLDEVNFLPKDESRNLTPVALWSRRLQTSAFRQVVEHLHDHVNRLTAAARTDGNPAPGAGIDLARYRQRAQLQWSAIDLGSLAMSGTADADNPIRLTDIFVPPNARRSRPPVTTLRDWLEQQGLDPDKEAALAEHRAAEWERLTPEPALDLIARADLPAQVILGDPGAGKSSLTRFVLLRLLAQDAVPGSPLATLHGHLPFLVELRDFVAWEPSAASPTLLDYLHYRGTAQGFGFTAAALEAHWAQHPSLLIIDGLDEIFDPARRRRMAEEIVGLGVRFPALRILLTARIVGFDEHPFRSAGFAIATLTDLAAEQVNGFARDWFRLVFPGDADMAERKRQELERALERPQLRVLAGNPLMLTLMATVARHKPLARSRAALYAQALELLCYNWDYSRGLSLPKDSPLLGLTPGDTSHMLRQIAWRMQEAPDGLRTNAITLADLRAVLTTFFRDVWNFAAPLAQRATAEMLGRLQERNWVLTLRGPDLFGFVHRTFLEYLCATELAERFKAQRIDTKTLIKDYVTPKVDDDTWHEVLRLLAGSLPDTVAEQIVLAIVPDRIDPRHPPNRLGLAWQVLAEIDPKRIPALKEACGRVTDRLYGWCEAGAWDVRGRVYAAIIEAAVTIGQIQWPLPCPPLRPWPLSTRGLDIVTGQAANTFALAAALSTTVWGCPDQATQYIRDRAVNDTDGYARGAAIQALALHFRDQPDTLPLLRERAVNDTDGYARDAAIQALAQHFRDQPDTLPLLRERAVNDTDGGARGAAIQALAEHFRDRPDTLPLLRVRAVGDADGSARLAAIQALAQHFRDQPDTLPLLRVRAVGDADGSARLAAIQALAQHFRDHPDTLPLLRERAVSDTDYYARGAAIQALAQHFRDQPDTLPLLRVRAVSDTDVFARRMVIRALAQDFRDHPDTLPFLRERAVGDADGGARGEAIQALAEHFRDHPDTLPFLRERAVGDADGGARGAAIQALTEHFRDHPDTLPLLRERAVNDTDNFASRMAIRALAQHFRDHPDTLPLLRERAVNDTDNLASRMAIRALAQHFRDHPDTLPLLRERAVGDADGGARGAAIQALALHFRDHPDTLPLLRERAVGDADGDARGEAIQALAEHFRDHPDTLPLLRERAVGDADGDARGEAIQALAEHFRDHPDTLPLLRERAVGDADGGARGEAIQALAEHFRDHPDTLPLLRERAVSDTDGYARGAALLGFAPSLPVPHAQTLCSCDLDGISPGLDPRAPITVAFVRKAAAQIGEPEAAVRGYYEQMASQISLTLEWRQQRGSTRERRSGRTGP